MKTTDLSQVTDKLDHIMLYTLPWSRFKLTTSVVIGSDCIGSCKSNYHTIMAMTALLTLISMLLFFVFFFVFFFYYARVMAPFQLCIEDTCTLSLCRNPIFYLFMEPLHILFDVLVWYKHIHIIGFPNWPAPWELTSLWQSDWLICV